MELEHRKQILNQFGTSLNKHIQSLKCGGQERGENFTIAIINQLLGAERMRAGRSKKNANTKCFSHPTIQSASIGYDKRITDYKESEPRKKGRIKYSILALFKPLFFLRPKPSPLGCLKHIPYLYARQVYRGEDYGFFSNATGQLRYLTAAALLFANYTVIHLQEPCSEQQPPEEQQPLSQSFLSR